MGTNRIYFKSLATTNGRLATETYDSDSKTRFICQTLERILHLRTIHLNTRHSLLPKRISTSFLTGSYHGSYRPEGILFETSQDPTYCTPVDLMALTNGKTFSSSDYDSLFIPGSDSLIFDSVEEMLELFPEPINALSSLNSLRISAGLKIIDKPFLYNECCFETPVAMSPVALVGSSEAVVYAATEFHLPIYPSTRAYVQPNPF